MAGSIAQDTDKMASYGLGDILGMALENEKEKREHEREMEKLDKISQVRYIENQQQNTSSDNNGFSLDRETVIGVGAVAVGAFAVYKLLF